MRLYIAAMVAVLLEKGVLTADEIRASVQSIENWGAKAEGPRIIAKAWADPEVSHPRLIVTLISSSPHLILTSCSPHPHIIITSSSPHPHLILIIRSLTLTNRLTYRLT